MAVTMWKVVPTCLRATHTCRERKTPAKGFTSRPSRCVTLGACHSGGMMSHFTGDEIAGGRGEMKGGEVLHRHTTLFSQRTGCTLLHFNVSI